MRKPQCASVVCLSACLLGAPRALSAQVTIGLGPFMGYYRPFGHFEPASVYSTQLASDPSQLRGRAWGATGQLTLRRLGLEAVVSTTRSMLPGAYTPGGYAPPTPARVTAAAVVGQYDLSPSPARYHLWVGAGPALVQYGEGGYARYGSPRSWGGAVGLGVTAPLWPRLELAAAATGFAYTFDLPMPAELRPNPGSLQHGAQRDALIHLGLRWRP